MKRVCFLWAVRVRRRGKPAGIEVGWNRPFFASSASGPLLFHRRKDAMPEARRQRADTDYVRFYASPVRVRVKVEEVAK